MRQGRLKLDSSVGAAVYHCITRTVAGERLLGDVDKEILRRMLWRVADFCGVEILAYCIMSNHVHVLVRVPEMREQDLDRVEILRRYRALYGEGKSGFFPEPDVLAALFADRESDEAARWEARLRVRMHDVSAFMQTLKQRFTIWFNHSHGRFGTLWAERFKSTLIENAPSVLRVVAAYIDLNPVRAGLVEDPGAYRWSSYGEALAGQERARCGLASVLGHTDWREAGLEYRLILFGKGSNGRVNDQGIIPRERVLEVIAQGGKVPLAELLRCRLKFLSDGAVLGSKAFVMGMTSHRGEASEAAPGRRKRRHVVGSILPVEEGEESLMALRSLRKNAVC